MKTDDDLIVADHPHADQRNWQPGDDDELTFEQEYGLTFEQYLALPGPLNRMLRTLDRMRVLTRLPPELLAATISKHVRIEQIIETKQYLEELARALGEQMQQKCAECGKDIWYKDDVRMTVSETGELGRNTTRNIQRVRRDARFCSPSCRQKAFRKRKRVTAKPSRTAA